MTDWFYLKLCSRTQEVFSLQYFFFFLPLTIACTSNESNQYLNEIINISSIKQQQQLKCAMLVAVGTNKKTCKLACA